ncbi:class I SAM-dependent methyltransferase [Actinacidiphila sp. DG2A-62]|uniref:class I SAM-dependent methyltransferase n=1 Tax=Actinacidiphila sp. DG2A-62 TaxID=3108821 RepID=UPI002DB55CFF|nr:class I SAM-dependent methyltransferase [Actinacidiphila sp. DG2A-62]MEC3996327.1 class I SAM-dependent methyltransferase [Actinacidiphila sp. DG2A-62]
MKATGGAVGTAGAGDVNAFDAFERRAWKGRAEAYAGSFAELCRYAVPYLLDAADVRAGAGSDVRAEGTAGIRVLDVGTGPGTVAAAAVARGARVTAVDAEPSMVARAARSVPEAEVRHALLPDLPFPDGAFDAVVANFVLNHVGRPAAALAELRRVTAPGGRIALTVWSAPHAPGQALLGRAVQAAGVERPASVPEVDAEEDFPRTEAGLAALFAAAGLPGARTRSLAWDHVVDADVWWSGPAAGIASVGQTVVAQPPEVIAEIHAHYEALAAEFRRPDGLLALPHRALLASAEVR